MDPVHKPKQTKRLSPARKLSVGVVLELLWGSLFEALATTIVILLLGGFALAGAKGIWKEMTPSSPPLFADLEVVSPAARNANGVWWVFAKEHRFGIMFGGLYAGLAGLQVATYSSGEKGRRVATKLREISQRVSEQWFTVVVGNAIGALAGAVALYWAQQFSYTKWLTHLLLGWFQPVIYGAANLVLNAGQISTIEGLISWYDDNQFKFIFWFLYSAAILDDLGIPNIKTLFRKLRRHFEKSSEERPKIDP